MRALQTRKRTRRCGTVSNLLEGSHPEEEGMHDYTIGLELTFSALGKLLGFARIDKNVPLSS